MSIIELKEKEFHNDTFASNKRQIVDKYYLTARKSRDCYEEKLDAFNPKSTILEYGCGTGSYSFRLAQSGHLVTGIDISDVGVEIATKQSLDMSLTENLKFIVMNAESLEFTDNSFDYICGTGIIHHLDTEKAFIEINRVLKPGGKAIFSEPLGHNPIINLYRKLTPKLRTEDEHPLKMSDLKTGEKTFGKIICHHFHFFTLLASPISSTLLFNPVLKILELIDSTLFKFLPFLRKYSWIVVIEINKIK